MPVDVHGYLEPYVIRACFSGEVSLEDMQQAAALLDARIAPQTEPVHVLIDLTDVSAYPWNLAAVNAILKPYLGHRHTGWTIFYGQKEPLIRYAANVLMRVSRIRFRIFDTEPEALHFLQEILAR
ncbi:MAG: STAS/SEC14 domain-containing protein [Anaerolineae bacterium]|jgi:hypothetical protein|nr:STAS/SEC14 domain-containing protein [Anaerolineae bacterium]